MDDKKLQFVDDFAKYGSIHEEIPPEKEKAAKVKYTKTEWMIISTLAFGCFCSGSCTSLQAPFFPAEAEKKGATATQYGLIFGSFSIALVVTAPIIGKLIAFTSPKLLIDIGYLTVGVTCISFGLLDFVEDTSTFVSLALVIRILEGVGTATLGTACFAIIPATFPDGLGTIFAILQTCMGFGLIVGPTLGGVLFDLGGYGSPFYVMGSLILLDAVVIFFMLPNLEHKKKSESGNLLKFWFHPTTLIYALSIFSCYYYIEFLAASLEPHLREFNLSGFQVGSLFALVGFVYAITAPAFGWLADKKVVDNQQLCLFGSFIIVISVFFIGPAPFFDLKENIGLILTALSLLGISNSVKQVSAFAGMMESTMERGFPADLSTYGLVSSMIAVVESLGAFFGPSLGGYLLDKYGFRKASMSILVLETVLIILLIISIFHNKFCRVTRNISLVKEPKLLKANGHILCENYLEMKIVNHDTK